MISENIKNLVNVNLWEDSPWPFYTFVNDFPNFDVDSSQINELYDYLKELVNKKIIKIMVYDFKNRKEIHDLSIHELSDLIKENSDLLKFSETNRKLVGIDTLVDFRKYLKDNNIKINIPFN